MPEAGWHGAGRYTRGAIAFHWTIAVLVITNVLIGIGHESFGEALGGQLMGVHKPIGILVLLLSFGRVGWRLAHRAPPLPAGTPAWEKGAAHAVHWLFYLFMLALPISGWWMSSAGARPHPIHVFGLFDVPLLPVSAGGGAAHQAHVVMGWTMAALILLHIGGALRHRLIKDDGVFERMWPFARARHF